ncbi:MAG: LamG domain-containing protein, partial [Acidobacteria bacterium]|nr:LamG domain-containing protein [Acidobacteriota bacterium]
MASPAFAQIASGTYQGDGVAGRAITGLGFQPDIVIVKVDFDGQTDPNPPCLGGDDCSSGVIRTSTMSGPNSKPVKGNQAYGGNLITALGADGFTVGNDLKVNALNSCPASTTTPCSYYWVALKADSNIKVGSYTGTGGVQPIGGLGFSPEYVAVFPETTHRALNRFGADANSYHWWAGSPDNPGITSLDATGFTVTDSGGNPSLNSSGTTYHYLAITEAAGRIRITTYPGTGAAQDVTSPGFQPELVLVKALDPASNDPLHKTTGMGGTTSINFRSGSTTNGITALLASGFRVGTSTGANASGTTYAYLAVGTGTCCALATVEGASTITVTGQSSFEMVFDRGFGGALESFYDLAEDPTRLYDLAGKPASNFHGLFHASINSGAVLYTSGTNAIGAKLDLLEATATRVRVRQEAFFQAIPPSTAILQGLKGIGDYSIYPAGKLAVRWNRRTTAPLLFTNHPLEVGVWYASSPDPRSSLTGFSETTAYAVPPAVASPAPATDDFVLARYDAPGARTDFLAIAHTDWAEADSLDFANAVAYFSWRDSPTAYSVTPLAANSSDVWDFLYYFKPTNFASGGDPAVTSRASDYRTPAVPTINGGKGSQWQDAGENTSAAGDFFNEAEAAYIFDMDSALGLDFDISGSVASPRYQPFFKIRGWRALGALAGTVTLNGTTLTRDADYKSDVKPVSRAHFANRLSFHSTLQDATALSAPDLGQPGGAANNGAFVAARYGNGFQVSANGDYAAVPITAFSPNKFRGAIAFWFQPSYASTDTSDHDLAGFHANNQNWLRLRKNAANDLAFELTASNFTSTYTVAAADYGWRAFDWVHVRIEWEEGVPCSPNCVGQQRILLNGVEPPHTDSTVDYVAANLSTAATTFDFGRETNGPNFSPGIYDEVHFYSVSSTTPTSLANGGLVGANEYLADNSGGKNFPLAFQGVDVNRTGQYAYIGSDSRFRGLTFGLATAGTGVAADALEWEYWNGTAWATLEAGCPGACTYGFTDTTSSLTRVGDVYWTSDPPGWSPYSVNGGPDLYYVRLHLANSSNYTVTPIESLVKTDILLFQYCGSITAAGQQFFFAPPVPTAVELLSFEAVPADSAVDLTWRTGSELHNLGFHLHRSLSRKGPWTRITASLIPGLGSSPEGASYSSRDTGLTNGVRYFYRLEDIDSESGSTFHGPVSAVPQAGAAPPADDGGSGDSDPERSSDSEDPTSQIYGRPGDVSFRVVSRTKHAVVVELETPGFVVTPSPEGLHVSVPGFDQPTDPRAPDLPLKRVVLDALVGRHARIVWVKERQTLSFPGLTPAAVGAAEIVSSPDGTVRPGRRAAALRGEGLLPPVAARIPGDAFIGELKKLALEMNPLRYDASSDTLLLAQT